MVKTLAARKISTLPSATTATVHRTWHSLFRKYAEPGYVQIYTKGEGLVEFNSLDEMEHVIRKLDNTLFNGEYIRLTVGYCLFLLVFVVFVVHVCVRPQTSLNSCLRLVALAGRLAKSAGPARRYHMSFPRGNSRHQLVDSRCCRRRVFGHVWRWCVRFSMFCGSAQAVSKAVLAIIVAVRVFQACSIRPRTPHPLAMMSTMT